MIADYNTMPEMFWECNRLYFDHQLRHMGAYAHDAREKYATTYRPVAAASLLVKLIHEADHHAAKHSHKVE